MAKLRNRMFSRKFAVLPSASIRLHFASERAGDEIRISEKYVRSNVFHVEKTNNMSYLFTYVCITYIKDSNAIISNKFLAYKFVNVPGQVCLCFNILPEQCVLTYLVHVFIIDWFSQLLVFQHRSFWNCYLSMINYLC